MAHVNYAMPLDATLYACGTTPTHRLLYVRVVLLNILSSFLVIIINKVLLIVTHHHKQYLTHHSMIKFIIINTIKFITNSKIIKSQHFQEKSIFCPRVNGKNSNT